MYKIVNIAPGYLTGLFQLKYVNDTGSNLWSVSSNNFVIPKPNNNLVLTIVISNFVTYISHSILYVV